MEILDWLKRCRGSKLIVHDMTSDLHPGVRLQLPVGFAHTNPKITRNAKRDKPEL
jgi:hypothetical protein